MPELSRFFGIVIMMNFRDHPPPHFHAVYGEHEATFDISKLSVLAGRFPPRGEKLVLEWASLHQAELLANWAAVRSSQSVQRIEPLE